MGDHPKSPARRFEHVFSHYPMVAAFAARRGSLDPEGIAAETMSIAWRRFDELNPDRCRPWLIATARNLLMDEYRNRDSSSVDISTIDAVDPDAPAFSFESLDPSIDAALASLDESDREALLLVAWEELTPREAAQSLGIKPSAFRVRLHRARRRFKKQLDEQERADRLVPLTSKESL